MDGFWLYSALPFVGGRGVAYAASMASAVVLSTLK